MTIEIGEKKSLSLTKTRLNRPEMILMKERKHVWYSHEVPKDYSRISLFILLAKGPSSNKTFECNLCWLRGAFPNPHLLFDVL